MRANASNIDYLIALPSTCAGDHQHVDTASPRASTQLDLESCRTDGDGMNCEPYTVRSFTFSDRDTNVSSTVMFCGLRICVDIFALNLQRSTQSLA